MSSIIVLHDRDNVGICKVALPAGVLYAEKDVTLLRDIPALHKFAVRPIAKGEAILKYGQTIGFASQDIPAGEHVHVHNCVMGVLEKDYGFCEETRPTAFVPTEQRATFQGYKRLNGKVGTRNFVGIITTVNCSATVAKPLPSTSHFPVSWNNIPTLMA